MSVCSRDHRIEAKNRCDVEKTDFLLYAIYGKMKTIILLMENTI
ncbi:hypothetical protein I656_01755 [Geobacillus sp. WSUCF1]|nr:hypothetical protein I656_01755 [Geobacillus sp. WSUCF1]